MLPHQMLIHKVIGTGLVLQVVGTMLKKNMACVCVCAQLSGK